MREIATELKGLRLNGMASAWTDLMTQGTSSTESSKWLIEHLLQAESTDRAMRSVSHQMHVARFPVHRDLAGFDFEASKADQHLVKELATLAFADTAQNVVFIGGPGTGKTHLATAIAVSGIALQGRRVRSTLPSTWSICWRRRSATARPGGALALMRMDLVILDELGTCHSARPAGPCCSTCSPSCTSAPA